MPAQHQQEYCHVSPSGKILKGPMALPQVWGSVSGFNHMKDDELAKRRWFPVRQDDSYRDRTHYRLLFLPEHQVVLKLPRDGSKQGATTNYVISRLYQMFGFFTIRPFYSDVLGETHMFPNTEHEQRHRQNCLLVGADYVCMAEDLESVHVRVVIPCDQIKILIADAVASYNTELEKLFIGLEDIQSATDAQLAAILDTNLADYYG